MRIKNVAFLWLLFCLGYATPSLLADDVGLAWDIRNRISPGTWSLATGTYASPVNVGNVQS
jgi:hypothetical protein